MTQEKEELAGDLDLSKKEDLSIGIMHLISLEEHLYFTAMKTGDEKMLKLLREIREMRTSLMKEIVEREEGENWCISKHLLGGSMRLIETGDKALETEGGDAKKYFDRAFGLYSAFWDLNLDEKPKGNAKTSEKALPNAPSGKREKIEDKSEENQPGLLERAKETVKDVLDCCIEK